MAKNENRSDGTPWWKILFEVTAVLVLVVYTTFAGLQWESMHDALLVDQRAWVSVVVPNSFPLDGSSILAPIQIANTGKTPAKDVEGDIVATVLKKGEEPSFDFSTGHPLNKLYAGAIFPNAPINIFIHGGAWRGGLARDSGYPAELFVHAGAHYVVPDFINVMEADGSLMPMAEQVRRAVAWVYRNAKEFGGDANRLYISGHSSGAHLAGVVLVTDWQKEFDLPADTVKGGLLCSGMYDLKPVRLSARSSYVKFTDEMEHALSTRRHIDRLNCPVVVAHGTLETPEFQRQTRDFAAAVKAAGKPVQFLIGQGYNHFEIFETLANPYGLLGRAALEQMKLAPG